MAETKAELEARAAELEAENERLRGQLATAGARPYAVAQPRQPWLSEGERQELEAYGVSNSPFTGRQITTAEARDAYPSVEISDAKPGAVKAAAARRPVAQPREGVDFVYPSVAPGRLAGDVYTPDAPVPVDTGADVDGDN